MQIESVEGDLLAQPVDAIVNAWNRNIIPWWLLLPQGVSGAIKRRAGYQPFWEVGWKGPIPLGGAVATSAGRLPYRAIIHVAGISMLWRASEQSVRDSVVNAVRLAESLDLRSLAFPLIGAGTGCLSEARVQQLIVETLESLDSGLVRAVVVRYARAGKGNPHPDPLPPGEGA